MIPWWVFAIGATLFGAAFAITRKQALKNVHALVFESSRSIANALLMLMVLPFIDTPYTIQTVGIVYVVSVIAVGGIILMGKAYRHMEISHLFPLLNLKPFFILIMAMLILGETITLRNGIGIFILLLGAYALEADHHIKNVLQPLKAVFKSKYSLYVIAALIMFSITSLMDKYIIDNLLDPLPFLALVWIFVAININIVHGILYGFDEVKKYIIKYPLFPFLVAFFSIGAGFLYLNALKTANVSLVAPVLTLATLFVVFFGVRFFKESNITYRLIVSVLMITGVYLVIT